MAGLLYNKGNSHLIDKLMTNKYPLGVVLIELAEQMDKADIALALDWAPRDQNAEADALTNGDFHDFSSDKRIVFEFGDLHFIVLNKLMATMAELSAEVAAAKARRGPVVLVPKLGRRSRLRATDPW